MKKSKKKYKLVGISIGRLKSSAVHFTSLPKSKYKELFVKDSQPVFITIGFND